MSSRDPFQLDLHLNTYLMKVSFFFVASSLVIHLKIKMCITFTVISTCHTCIRPLMPLLQIKEKTLSLIYWSKNNNLKTKLCEFTGLNMFYVQLFKLKDQEGTGTDKHSLLHLTCGQSLEEFLPSWDQSFIWPSVLSPAMARSSCNGRNSKAGKTYMLLLNIFPNSRDANQELCGRDTSLPRNSHSSLSGLPLNPC